MATATALLSAGVNFRPSDSVENDIKGLAGARPSQQKTGRHYCVTRGSLGFQSTWRAQAATGNLSESNKVLAGVRSLHSNTGTDLPIREHSSNVGFQSTMNLPTWRAQSLTGKLSGSNKSALGATSLNPRTGVGLSKHESSTNLGFRSIPRWRAQATAGKSTTSGIRWWEKDGGPNFHDVHSTQEFLNILSTAGEKLVVVEFYATWCGSCRALYPKLCQIAEENPDVVFAKVGLEANRSLCKSLNIKVLPFFHFYRGSEGRLDAFSCYLTKLHKLRDAIALHNTDRCSIGTPVGVRFLGEQGASASTSPR